MPIPSFIKELVAVLDNIIKTTTNPCLLGIKGVISNLVKVSAGIQGSNKAKE